MDVFDCLVKSVNDCNFQGQLSLDWLFSKSKEGTSVLCDHSEIKAIASAFLPTDHVPFQYIHIYRFIHAHTQLDLILFVVFCIIAKRPSVIKQVIMHTCVFGPSMSLFFLSLLTCFYVPHIIMHTELISNIKFIDWLMFSECIQPIAMQWLWPVVLILYSFTDGIPGYQKDN